MHYSVEAPNYVIIVEDQKFNYLFFCSSLFEVEKKEKGELLLTYSPIGYRTYEYQFKPWDHHSVIKCDPLAAEKLMLLRNHYKFPSSDEMTKALDRAEKYPESMINLYPDWSEAS